MSVQRTDTDVYIDHGDRLLRLTTRSGWGGLQLDVWTPDGKSNFHLSREDEVAALVELLGKATNLDKGP